MENASKALIIAGAILLSILIIALGIYVYNQARASMTDNGLDATEIQTFNDPLLQYEGSQLGSSVRSLVASLIVNATTNEGAEEKLPTVVYDSNNGGSSLNNAEGGSNAVSDVNTYKNSLQDLRDGIANTHRYTVTTDYNEQGYIGTITIAY